MESNKRPENMERITTASQAKTFIETQISALREQIGGGKVLLALSGGVDSSVCAALLIKAVGKQLVCVHVNHGLMRKGESEQVIEVFRNRLDANLVYVDAADRFLSKLAGISDPEQAQNYRQGVYPHIRGGGTQARWHFLPCAGHVYPTFSKAARSRRTITSEACPKI